MPRQTTATLSLDVAAESSLASSLNPANLELVLNPTPLGAQVTGELTATVATDNPTGYKLTLQTKTSNTSLTHLNGVDTIGMTTNSTPGTLGNNTWGFNPMAGADTFRSIPADGQTPYTLKQTTATTPSEGEASAVTIGARADTSIPAGLYGNTITFTATANPLPAPTITGTSPANGPTAGGTALVITGTNFYAPVTVTVGGGSCASIVVVSTTRITCNTPTGTAGARAVTVTTSGGTITQAGGFFYIAPPTVSSISPTVNMRGGDIYITGTNFYGGTGASVVTGVKVGSSNCASYLVLSNTSIRCTIPGIPNANSFAISVVTIGGTSNTNRSVTTDEANKGTMQEFTPALCAAMTMGLAQVRTDSRDADPNVVGTQMQQYRVKKMPDNKCWMIDNLRYAHGTLVTGTTPMAYSSASYADPGGGTGFGASNFYGYLYNRYGANYGTGMSASLGATVTGSICPNASVGSAYPWRLPSLGDNGISATNEFMGLSGLMAGLTAADGAVAQFIHWGPTGSWGGTFAGSWTSSGMNDQQGTSAYYWGGNMSPTSVNDQGAMWISSFMAYSMFGAGGASGRSVRCVLGP